MLFLNHKLTSELLYIGANEASLFSECVNIRTQNLRKNRHGADVAQYRHRAVFFCLEIFFRSSIVHLFFGKQKNEGTFF